MKLARSLSLRLLYGLLSLLFISFVTFIADEVAPGDAATVLAGEKASPETLQRIRHQMGLDRPWPVRYIEFIGRAVTGDFGASYYGTKDPVSRIIAQNLPWTVLFASLAMVLASFVGVLLGVLAAVYQNRPPDRAALAFSTLGVTIPNFVLAPILVYLFALKLDMLPITWEVERRAPLAFYLILPVVILAARPMAAITRLTRASMIDVLGQEFIRLAIAKGVPPLRLVFKHALRNALLPVATNIGTSFGILLTGSFIVETAFAMPGIGREAIEAIRKGDAPVIQAVTLVTGGLFVLINLIVDLFMPLLDPRIREAQV